MTHDRRPAAATLIADLKDRGVCDFDQIAVNCVTMRDLPEDLLADRWRAFIARYELAEDAPGVSLDRVISRLVGSGMFRIDPDGSLVVDSDLGVGMISAADNLMYVGQVAHGEAGG